MNKYEFHREARERKDFLKQLRRDAESAHDSRMIHLCFTCDPYPLVAYHTTRQAILILKETGHSVQILTKGGAISTHDFDLLDDLDEYAATLTLNDDHESRMWEPQAALPFERIRALKLATERKIKTWASLEPVIFPEQSLSMLHLAINEAGISKVKIGPLNYKGRLPKWLASTVPENVDWKGFVAEAQKMCGSTVECILKNDLKALIGEAE
jgi:DNA repair photolyase